ncbi:hypothetical protein M9Q43_09015 [Flavobacterium sp. HXWNR29]|uniref:hypothetical protein n=1 Tax=Flavobacterium odoriferum TaxID=2946604 RepID=UPI0021CB208A|nr:hypothetical protein [Flavobacterium sp. HXWNR29]MCU4189303.1 hypothetical protein [Flavobacterium sp. HXWNR29]
MNRLLNLGLLIAFQFCYLEWPNHSMFVFEAEYDIFSKTESLFNNLMHPIILLGLITQLLLLLGFVLKYFNKKINNIAVLLLSILVLFIFLIGILDWNYKIITSTTPFLILAGIYFTKLRKIKKI